MLTENQEKVTSAEIHKRIQDGFDSQNEYNFVGTINKIKELTKQFFEKAEEAEEALKAEDVHSIFTYGEKYESMRKLLEKINEELLRFKSMAEKFNSLKASDECFDESGAIELEEAKRLLLNIYFRKLFLIQGCCEDFLDLRKPTTGTRTLDSCKSRVNGWFNNIETLLGHENVVVTTSYDVESEEKREEDRGRNRNENRISLNGALRSIRSGLSMLGGFLFKVVKSPITLFSFLRKEFSERRGGEETRLFVLQQEPTTSKQKSDLLITKDKESAGASLPQQKAEEDKPSILFKYIR